MTRVVTRHKAVISTKLEEVVHDTLKLQDQGWVMVGGPSQDHITKQFYQTLRRVECEQYEMPPVTEKWNHHAPQTH